MRILLVGAGGVGTAFARIAARRRFADLVVADYDLARAQQAAAAKDGYVPRMLRSALGSARRAARARAPPCAADPRPMSSVSFGSRLCGAS